MTLFINEFQCKDFKTVSVATSLQTVSKARFRKQFVEASNYGLGNEEVTLSIRTTGANARADLAKLRAMAKGMDFWRIRSTFQKPYDDKLEVYAVVAGFGGEEENGPFYYGIPITLVFQGDPQSHGIELDLKFEFLANDFFATESTDKKCVVWLPDWKRFVPSTLVEKASLSILKTRTVSADDGTTAAVQEWDLNSYALTPSTGDAANVGILTDPKLTNGSANVRELGIVKLFAVDSAITTTYTTKDISTLPNGWRRIYPGQVNDVLGTTENYLVEVGGLSRWVDGQGYFFDGSVWQSMCNIVTVATKYSRIQEFDQHHLKITNETVVAVFKNFNPIGKFVKTTSANWAFNGFTSATDGTNTGTIGSSGDSVDVSTNTDNYIRGSKTGIAGSVVFGMTKKLGWRKNATSSQNLEIKQSAASQVVFVGFIPEVTNAIVAEEAHRALKDGTFLGAGTRPFP